MVDVPLELKVCSNKWRLIFEETAGVQHTPLHAVTPLVCLLGLRHIQRVTVQESVDLLQIYTVTGSEFWPRSFVCGFSFFFQKQLISLGLQQLPFQQKSGLAAIAALIAMSDIS